jgi:hypothetical protein
MDKKSKILITVIFSLIILSIVLTFNRTLVKKDFDIENSEEVTVEE